MTPVPPYDPSELAHARLRALERREVQAELKQLLADGKITVKDLLDKGRRGQTPAARDMAAGHLDVGETLLAVSGIGPQSAMKICNAACVDPDRHLDTLSDAQREVITRLTQQIEAGR